MTLYDLENFLVDCNSYQGLKSLEQSLDGLRTPSTGKAKFAFKRKAQKPISTPAPSPVPNAITQHQEQSPVPTDVAGSSNSVALSGRTHQYLSWTSVPSMTVSATDLSISDLDGCVVNFLGDSKDAPPLTFTALHMRNVRNTVLLLPFIQGSAMIHDMSNSVTVLGCHQVRKRTSFVFCVEKYMFASFVCILRLRSTSTSRLIPILSSSIVRSCALRNIPV